MALAGAPGSAACHAAKIMAADLADTPVAGLETQLCGDSDEPSF